MVFVPEAAPTLQVEGFAHWFVFCRETMLVCLQCGEAVIPYADAGPVPETDIVRRVYLGRLDGCPCYAAEVLHDQFVLPGMEFLGLRKLSGLFDEGIYRAAGRAAQLLHWDRTHQYCGRCGTHGQKRRRMSMPGVALPAV